MANTKHVVLPLPFLRLGNQGTVGRAEDHGKGGGLDFGGLFELHVDV